MAMTGWTDSLTLAGVDPEVSWESLAEVGKALRPGGTITVTTIAPGSLAMNLMVAGFVDVVEGSAQGAVFTQISASKAKYEAGASHALKTKPGTSTSVWTLEADDFGEDQDMIDEDDLLTQEEIGAKPELPACGPKSEGKRACADCSCGYAEALDKEKIANGEVAVKSACGSCYKGDAFRCANCPMRGMPAFKPGEKVELNLTDDI